MQPLKKELFDKLMFCDQLFEWIELEESLYFTALDVEFHANHTGSLFDTNMKHFSKMTIFEETKYPSETPKPPSREEVEKIVQ